MSTNETVMDLSGFEEYINKLLPDLKRRYDRSVNMDLSRQQWQGLFQRNITVVLQKVYQEMLELLQQMKLNDGGTLNGIDMIHSALLAFDKLIDEFIQYALQKHRSSCALSNFPDEHNPSQLYIAEVTHAIQEDWSSFVEQVDSLMAA